MNMSAVMAASVLNELANIQITGNRNRNESASITITNIQLIVFCFFVRMLFLLLILCQYSLYDCKYHDKYCKYNRHG